MASLQPDSDTEFKLIVSLENDADWEEGARLLREAGLQIESVWKEIRTISGRAKKADVQTIASVFTVKLIEMDESMSAMDSTRLP